MLRIATYNLPESGSLQSIASRYQAESVEVVTFNADVYENLVLGEKSLSQAGGFDLYDISFALVERLANQLEDVSELVGSKPEAAFDQPFQGLISRLSASGRLIGAPWRSTTYISVYRADIAQEIDLEAPDTIPRAIEFARVVHDRFGISGYAAAQRGSLHQSMDWLPFLWDFGGDILDGDRVVLDSPEAVAALNAYVELNQFSPWQSLEFEYRDPADLLLAGDVGMVQLWCSAAAAVLERATDPQMFAFLPGLGVPVTGGGGLGIPRGSESTNAARQFMGWWLRPEIDIERVKLGGAPIYGSTYAALTDHRLQPIWEARRATQLKCKDRPRHRDWPLIQRILARVGREALLGKTDIRTLLAEGTQEIREILATVSPTRPAGEAEN